MRNPILAIPLDDTQDACPALPQADPPPDYRDARNNPLDPSRGGLDVPPGYFFRSGPAPRPIAQAATRFASQVTARRWSGCRRVQF